MDYSLLGNMLDSTKCGKLGMEERRKFVRELAKDPRGTPETLLSWSRQEILQLLCVEMGKERKYTGLTKLKIIENLLKIVSENSLRESGARGSEQPVPDSSGNSASGSNGSSAVHVAIQCKNSACKASLRPEDAFCKRCSCCICQKFDDNKDPSLWLTCSSEPPFESDSCNMSCHLECALRHDRSGLSKRGQVAQLDGSFYCVSCGKMNDLLKCWRKQLMIARDTRRVDILCYRVFLSQKLLSGTNKYQKLSEIVDEAVSKLQAEVGPLTDVTVKMGRGIVNRMSTGHQVQRLCASAVELLDAMLPQATTVDSLTRPADQGTADFVEPSTCEARVSNAAPAAERSQSPVTNCSTLSNPSSVEDETNNIASVNGPRSSCIASDGKEVKNAVSGDQSGAPVLENSLVEEPNGSDKPTTTGKEIVPCPPPETGLPITPSRVEVPPQPRSSSKKRNRESQEEDDGCDGNEDLEFYVKAIRSLECEGHIEKSFRQKLLTWFSLRATPRETLVVQVFVNTLRDDPAALAEQLIDAFEEIVSGKRSEPPAGPGLCMKLWH